MVQVKVVAEIDGETWEVRVHFNKWNIGPQYDDAPAEVTRDGEPVLRAKWANVLGGEPKNWALVDNGCLWAPGVVGVRPVTEAALAKLTLRVQREVWATRGTGRANAIRARREARVA